MALFPHLRVGTFIEAQKENQHLQKILKFPHLRVGTFIEAPDMAMLADIFTAFPRFWSGTFIEALRGSHESPRQKPFPCLRVGISSALLSMNREISRRLLSPVLETTMVSRTGLFSLKHEDTLDAASTADSSCRLSESEMTKSDARNL